MVALAKRILAIAHRWWGIAFCSLFAMWFASGIVMHFVPFPSRSEGIAATMVERSSTEREQIICDQWTVTSEYDPDRPLTRITLDDASGTEIYISRSGKVVLVTTRNERLLKYAGSIAHWFYPIALRRHAHFWTAMMWWIALLATTGAALGAIFGLLRLSSGLTSEGLRRWHHVSGLVFAPILLSWTFSGFLSMDEKMFVHGGEMFRTMHKLDFPPLSSHPLLRSIAIVSLCLYGLAFSLSGVVLAWKRMAIQKAWPRPD